MREPPQPGDRIVLLYRDGETKYSIMAMCGATLANDPDGLHDTHVGVRVNNHTVLYHRLTDEGVTWARVAAGERWTAAVPALLAARALAAGDA